jgi:hypothetical protein
VRGVFHLRNVNIVGFFYYLFKCYMFRSYNHLQADIFYRNYSTDNGSVVFRVLVIIMNDYSDRSVISRLLLIWLLLYKLNGDFCSSYYSVDVFILVCTVKSRLLSP